MNRVAALFAVLATLAGKGEHARADAQISSRLGVGGGASVDRAPRSTDGVFDLNAYADILWGAPSPTSMRIGPFLEFGTSDFASVELSIGATLQMPIFAAFPINLGAGVGWAERYGDSDSLFAEGRITFGYHAYNYLSAYAYALGLYVETRIDMESDGDLRITGGIEIDFEFLIGVPLMFVTTQLTHGDPDE